MLWMAVFVALMSRRWALAGVCCGLALLVRPNLLPLAIVAGVYVLLAQLKLRPTDADDRRWTIGRGAAMPRSVRPGRRLPFVAVILWLNDALYGGPLRSGYGQLNVLFSVAHLSSNARQYGRWLLQTQTILIVLGLLAPRAVPKDQRGPVWLALALIVATAAIYFAYTPFDDWSYLRFLLPAIGLLIVLTSVVLARAGSLMGRRASYVLVALVTVTLGVNGVAVARDRLAFQMQALEQRYRSAGIVVRDRLPAGRRDSHHLGQRRDQISRPEGSDRLGRARSGVAGSRPGVAVRERPPAVHSGGVVGGAALPRALRRQLGARKSGLAAEVRSGSRGADLRSGRPRAISARRAGHHGISVAAWGR